MIRYWRWVNSSLTQSPVFIVHGSPASWPDQLGANIPQLPVIPSASCYLSRLLCVSLTAFTPANGLELKLWGMTALQQQHHCCRYALLPLCIAASAATVTITIHYLCWPPLLTFYYKFSSLCSLNAGQIKKTMWQLPDQQIPRNLPLVNHASELILLLIYRIFRFRARIAKELKER